MTDSVFMDDQTIRQLDVEELELSPDELVPYEHNAKEHNETQINDLAHSLQDFSQFQPVVVNSKNVIIIGHGRVLAAKKLGLEKLHVWRVKNYDDVDARALRIVDNKLNLDTGFDAQKLRDCVNLANEGYDLSKYSFKFNFADPDVRGVDVDTTAEKREAFENNPIKQVVFYFTAEEFPHITKQLDALRAAHSLESNSEALLYLLASHGMTFE